MRHLGIMAKYWQPGFAKTRLAQSVGHEAAAAFHKLSLLTLLSRFQGSADRRFLYFTPADKQEAFQQMAGRHWECVPQSEGDLGDRIAWFFRDSLGKGGESAVLLGADSPNLPQSLIEEAFAHLTKSPVVLGPADDGGYYLVGGSGVAREKFLEQRHPLTDISWGSAEVLAESLRRFNEIGMSVGLLSPWYDIDDIQGLRRLFMDLMTFERGNTVRLRENEEAGAEYDLLRDWLSRYLPAE